MSRKNPFNLRLLAKSMTQCGWIALLVLAPAVSRASLIVDCGRGCIYHANETVVGDVVTIDFSAFAEHGGQFELSEVLVTDFSGPGFIEWANLTFFAGVYGPASAGGELGEISCGASSTGNGGPDDHSVTDHCSDINGGVWGFAQGELPLDMRIQLGDRGYGSSGEVYLQARFSEVNMDTGKSRPLSVHFLVPEPSSIVLCAVGLVGLALLKRQTAVRPDCGRSIAINRP